MATCVILGCDNELSERGRMKTCATCRQSLHSWERRKPDEIIDRTYKLIKYRARMNTFSVVKDDDVSLVDHKTLEEKRLMSFPVRRSKAKAKSIAVAAKLRDRARKQA